MTAPDPRRFIVPDTKKRDILIALAAAVGVLALVLTGIIVLSKEQGKPSTNQLSGVIVAKHARGELTFQQQCVDYFVDRVGPSDVLEAKQKRDIL